MCVFIKRAVTKHSAGKAARIKKVSHFSYLRGLA